MSCNNEENKKTNLKVEIDAKGDTIREEDIEIIIDEETAKQEQARKKYSTKLADSGGCIYGDLNRGAKA